MEPLRASTISHADLASAMPPFIATFQHATTFIGAVYRTEVEKLTAAEQRFADSMPPIEALRAWMLLFIDYAAENKLILPALDTVAGG
jgi:hypothetical protein